MSLSKRVMRKVDSEMTAFIPPDFINAKCWCVLSAMKLLPFVRKINIRRHHETKCGTFKVAFPLQTEAWKRKIETLTVSYAHSSRIVVWSLTATSTSLKVFWVLASHNTDADTYWQVEGWHHCFSHFCEVHHPPRRRQMLRWKLLLAVRPITFL